MVDFKGRNEIPTATVPNPPTQCNCGNPVDFVSLSVYDDRGQVHTGSFSDYGYKKGNGSGGRSLHLKGDYTYAHWNGVCSGCHVNPADWRRELLKENFISLEIRQDENGWKGPCMDAMKRMAFGKLVGRG